MQLQQHFVHILSVSAAAFAAPAAAAAAASAAAAAAVQGLWLAVRTPQLLLLLYGAPCPAQ